MSMCVTLSWYEYRDECINGMMHRKIIITIIMFMVSLILFIYIFFFRLVEIVGSRDYNKNFWHVDGRDNIRMLVTSTIINFRIVLSGCTIENAWLVHTYIYMYICIYIFIVVTVYFYFLCCIIYLFFIFTHLFI